MAPAHPPLGRSTRSAATTREQPLAARGGRGRPVPGRRRGDLVGRVVQASRRARRSTASVPPSRCLALPPPASPGRRSRQPNRPRARRPLHPFPRPQILAPLPAGWREARKGGLGRTRGTERSSTRRPHPLPLHRRSSRIAGQAGFASACRLRTARPTDGDAHVTGTERVGRQASTASPSTRAQRSARSWIVRRSSSENSCGSSKPRLSAPRRRPSSSSKGKVAHAWSAASTRSRPG